MTRLRWRVAATAVASLVVVPSALVGGVQTAAHACDRDENPFCIDVVIDVNGTICWEGIGPEGTSPTARVTLSEAQKEPVTVVFNTQDGTAVAPADYAAIRDTRVTVSAGQLSVEVPLKIVPDDIEEPDEYFVITISDPSTGTIGRGQDVVIIKDGKQPR
jgi:hypothetical protein